MLIKYKLDLCNDNDFKEKQITFQNDLSLII
jgi:hypothetical protein